MVEFDEFANQLLEEAKRFLEKASEAEDKTVEAATLHAALLLSCCALEAHVNAVAQEFANQSDLSAHEIGLLLEREVKLEGGAFQAYPSLKMSKLEDRIEFLHLRFSGKPVDRQSSWWSGTQGALNLRNQLVHAKTVPPVTYNAVRNAIQSIIDTLDVLYKAIYKKKFPPSGLGLDSTLTF